MFKVNMIGTAIAIVLIIISLFTKYVYGMNLFYKYRQINSKINHRAIGSAKEIINQKIVFKIKDSFFIPIVNCKKKVLNLTRGMMINNTIYDQINVIFNSYLFNLNFKKKRNIYVIEILLLIFAFLLSVNIIWTLCFGFWIISGSLFAGLIFMTLINLIICQKNVFIAIELTKEYLKLNEDRRLLKSAFSYLKYKKISILINYISIFSEPILSLIKNFGELGKNE